MYFCIVCCNCSFFIFNFIDLMSLTSGLSILFIFSQNQLLVLLIFATVSLISFSLIYDLIFMISFLMLTLGVFVLFPAALDVELGCLFNVSCFLRYDCITINFLLRTAFAESCRFWIIMFSLSLVSRNLLISFLISSVISLLFSNVLFILHEFVFFAFFSPCSWYLVS